jgi:UrcA family protein
MPGASSIRTLVKKASERLRRVVMSPRNRNRGIFSGLTLLCSAALLTTGAIGAQPHAPPTVDVSYVKADLSKPEAAEALYKRIQAAARRVCQEPSGHELWWQNIYRHCYEKAVEDAVVKVDSTTLTAVHRSRTQRSAAG